ncbi:MAG: response regulator, partial [Gammaproteobacteria bacterium]|nr:response regulator [Gammaproteobacteria bacterium]
GSELNDEQKHQIEIAQFSAHSLLTLINDILDYSKVDAGKLDLELIDYDVRGLMGEIAESMAQQAQDKGIELILDVVNIDQSIVNSDPGRLRQILTNLIGNAIKFTEQGEIIIRASTQDIGNDQLKLCCSITDTGIGIPDESKASLFDSFTQVDTTTTRKYGGTGLGLAISKKLCELLGGEINVSSTEGKGSCFKFNILLLKSKESSMVIPPVDISSLQILIVANNSSNREILKAQFERWGAKVVLAETADKALQKCKNEYDKASNSGFDIAFLDMLLPEMSAEELGQALKSNPHFSQIKLVMMTPVAAYVDTKHCLKVGFSACFPKPATTADLINVLSNLSGTKVSPEHTENKKTTHSQQSTEGETVQNLDEIIWPHGTRILLVEDNVVNQLVVEGILEYPDLKIEMAINGLQALKILNSSNNETPFTCVLMDCQMPEMDGFEATRLWREQEQDSDQPRLPIIAMTANVMEGDRELCLLAGMDDYLGKPVRLTELGAVLQRWI